MRRGAAATLAAAVLGACAPGAAPPAPPPGAQALQGELPNHVDLAAIDLVRRLDAEGLHKGGVGYYRMPSRTRFEDVRAYYAARLGGWSPVAGFPERTLGARAAAWRRGREAVAVALIERPEPEGTGASGFVVLAVVQPGRD